MQHFRLHQGFVTIGSFLLARSNVFSHRELASPQSGLRGQVKGLLRHHWAGGLCLLLDGARGQPRGAWPGLYQPCRHPDGDSSRGRHWEESWSWAAPQARVRCPPSPLPAQERWGPGLIWGHPGHPRSLCRGHVGPGCMCKKRGGGLG